MAVCMATSMYPIRQSILRHDGPSRFASTNRDGALGLPNRPGMIERSPSGGRSGLVTRTFPTSAERQKKTMEPDCEKKHQVLLCHMLHNVTCERRINSFKTFLTHEPGQYIIKERETLGPIREEMRIAGSEARIPTGGRAVSY